MRSLHGSSGLAFTLVAITACGTPHRDATGPANTPVAVREAPASARSVAPEEPVALEEPAPQQPAESEQPAPLEIPSECAKAGAKVCTPPAAFVDKLCQSRSADVALAMFRKATPWTRAYLRRDMEAWYAGSRLASPVQMVLDEEVIVVASRTGGSGGVQLVGAGSYDVYRWDGKCVSVMADEVSLRRPPVLESAPVAWKSLAEATREALLADKGIKLRRELVRDRCREDGSAPRCTEATAALIRLIADYVRKGGKLPDTRLTVR